MMNPEMDDDGYPTEATLEQVASWPINRLRDCETLIDFVGEAWYFRDWGWTRAARRHRRYRGSSLTRKYTISTGGWSGNESLINALYKHPTWWMLCFQQERRGGHYIFEVPAEG